LPMILANGVTLLLAVAILVMKLRFMMAVRRRLRAAAQRGL